MLSKQGSGASPIPVGLTSCEESGVFVLFLSDQSTMALSSALVMVNTLTLKVLPASSPRLGRSHHPLLCPFQRRRPPVDRVTPVSSILSTAPAVHSLVLQFDPSVPIEEAATPPSSWYIDPSFLDLELDRVFHRGWQVVGRTDQIKSPQDFFTGRLGKVEYVVCRDDDGTVCAFHNVCLHHASLLASGSGSKSCFVCPYHGWTYALNGALLKATRIKGIRNFDVKDFGLKPLKVATWGPFVLLKLDDRISADLQVSSKTAAHEWIGSCLDTLSDVCLESSLHFLCRREYIIECNWKVYCDNYLDGGYHVPYAHKGLASGLKLDSYSTTLHDKVSLQRCEGGPVDGDNNFDRLGKKATYAFIYPNFMINRYGPWMDTNLVLPLTSRKCCVIFDYFLEGPLQDDHTFIDRSLQESERVQAEDIVLCEGVQGGLESPAYCSGRYAPTVENAMHHFHRLLHLDLIG